MWFVGGWSPTKLEESKALTCWRTALRKVLGLKRLLRSTGLSSKSPRATAPTHRERDAFFRAMAVSHACGVSGPSHKRDLFGWFRRSTQHQRCLKYRILPQPTACTAICFSWGARVGKPSKFATMVDCFTAALTSLMAPSRR